MKTWFYNSRIRMLCAAVLLVLSLAAAGCGGTEEPTESVSSSENQIHGTVEDAGQINALCPDGWISVGVPDLETTESGVMRTNALRFVKGSADDLENSAFIDLCYYSSTNEISELEPEKWYDNVTGTGNIVTGDYTWNGYTALSLGAPFVYLETETPNAAFTASIYTQDGKLFSASINDADVQAILSSVKVSAK